ncbi:ubiquitin thioesterase OTUB1 [Trichonephila inaurata madagascariensis]|uniref:ubiquitinyl hydrolase 1 n=1 Tax=Trichonephila inaurata madagascariensis TaxID=2747483 RepID=A0A8X6KMJ8_9ARAC|nr:ubiquitin thioesterase OTUB1 [Trichonephila inaurata madagascariensis]
MGEETERISVNLTKDVNQDEAIMAQEREIEREIAETNPLIGPKCDLALLQKEYAEDDLIYQQKVNDLRSKYRYVRKMRPDGNCFFRAFTFAYLESLLNDKQEYKRFKEIASKTKEDLVSLGFSQFTIEDFHDTFMDVLGKIEQEMTVEDLLAIFNDQGSSDYIVVYMRLITSGYLQKEEAFFSNFIEGERTVKEFCHQEVEPMYKESDHIHVIALTLALGVGVRVQYMDRGEGGHINNHDFPEDKTPRIHLLYRPGHYDILY